MGRIKLGMKVRDRVSSYEGIAVALSQYLTGCDRVGIQPLGLKPDGSIPDTLWFDQPWVEVVDAAVIAPVEPRRAEDGGPGRGITLSRSL